MEPDVEKRLRYFNGQFLQEKDFTDEQAYHIDRQRRHNRLLHTPGIAEGLDVEAGVGARGAKVKPGTAVDAKGQFIVLAQERPVDFKEQHFGQTVLLVIHYDEKETDPATDGGGGKTRCHERPRVEVVSEDEAPSSDPHIQLARLVISETGTVSSEPDTSVRRGAGVSLRGEVEVRQLTLARDGVDPSQWPALSCGAAGRADLTGDLSVSGNVGIGTKTPDTLLTVGDGTNRDLLKFVNTAKGWRITASGSGADTTLDLQALESGKSFRVVSRDGTRVPLQVHTSDAEGRNAVYLVQNGGHVGIGTTEPGDSRLKVEGGDTYLGGELTVTGATRLNNELTVTGNVDIGTTEPDPPKDSNGYLHARDVWLEDAHRWVGDWPPTAQAIGTRAIEGAAEVKDMENMSVDIAGTTLLCKFSGTFSSAAAHQMRLHLCIDNKTKYTSSYTIFSPQEVTFHWTEVGLSKGKHTVKVQWTAEKVHEIGHRVLDVMGL